MPFSDIVAKTYGMKNEEIVAFLSPILAPLRISFDDIVSATNNFANDHFIKRGNFSDVYKGKLLWSKEWIDVVIRRYPSFLWSDEGEFLREIQEYSDRKHRNALSIVGFCDENGEKFVVFEYQHNGSLDKYLSDPTALTWSQRLKICLGAASLLRYIHEDVEDRLYHDFGNYIKSSRILLDRDWEAKVFCSASHLDVLFFGVILFEVICGKKAEVKDGGAFARMAKQHYEEGKLDDIINPDLRKQMHPISLSILSQIAYNCLQERNKRPRMNSIVEGLQQALEVPLELENLVEILKHLEIQLDVILSATNKFNETYCIGSGGYGKVYKAELYLSDRVSSLASEIMSEDKLPRNRTVAIKRIKHREDGLGIKGFLAELELLNRCEHPNILRLLGFCVKGPERILVYEYASNGSLDDYLNSTDKMINLTWDQRLKMCLGIANGLNYLHKAEGRKRVIIHRDIKSDNILLDENLEVKIADFGLSIFHPTNHPESTIHTKNFAGTDVYADPEYLRTGKLKVESDIYSFGVVLFEILSGKSAYDSFYTYQYEKGLAHVAREHFSKGTIMELVDATLMNEAHELSSTLRIGPDQRSLDAFCKVAYECLAETQVCRPKMEVIIEELKKALHFQENRKDTLNISLEDIRFDGQTFSDNNCNISRGLGMVYNGEVQYDNGCKVGVKRLRRSGLEPGNGCEAIAVKRLRRSGLEPGIWREFEIPFKHRHENIVGLVGYCKKMDEKFIVYEHTSNQSLDLYLNDADFSWTKRLKICIDIANGLDFLHRCDVGQEVVIHRCMKSSNILLTGDWKAKISGFEVSLISPINQEIGYVVNDVVGSPGYCDPLYWDKHFLTKESDIYSFGVILFEVLCGRLACHKDNTDAIQFLDDLVKHQHGVGRLEDIVFDGIKEQMVRESFLTFRRIAIQCLDDEVKERPTAGAVLEQLQKALEFQEAYEILVNKLPRNYIEILEFSKSPEIYSTMGKKDIYNILSKGILLQEDKLWFSVGINGERNEMISATTFLYKNSWSHRWQSIQESRFEKVAKILDISNLNIQIKKSSRLLLPGISCSVHLVFKFCCLRKSNAKRMYVNLKYKIGDEKLNAYFATWREDGWMMIELYRFSNHKEETNVDVLLKSFSRCCCDSRAIYIEGIEFRSIDNVKQEEIGNSKEIEHVLNLETDKFPSTMKSEVPAEWVLYDSSNAKLYPSNLSSQSRSERIIKLPGQEAFRIKWDIGSQMVSPHTKSVCYLVFKLSENCSGLHCPVIIRDRSNWETEILYFRSPSPWNLLDTDRVPKKREDGWMEVIVRKFNTNCLFMNLELITYEGTMSGLIVSGLEFRPS